MTYLYDIIMIIIIAITTAIYDDRNNTWVHLFFLACHFSVEVFWGISERRYSKIRNRIEMTMTI